MLELSTTNLKADTTSWLCDVNKKNTPTANIWKQEFYGMASNTQYQSLELVDLD